MNNTYLRLMEKTLSAYSVEHIIRYFNDVKQNGLTEHGFPRLTVSIGILIAYGKRRDLLTLFLEMMEFCCKAIPTVKAENDFSVREIVCCIMELEKTDVVAVEDIVRWKGYLATIEPEKCYDKFATSVTDSVKNWALFTAVSEYFRQSLGVCDSSEFIELQIAQQLQWFDENGMYMDGRGEYYQPIAYDLVPRMLFSLLLHAGYRGRYYEKIDGILRKAGLLTLRMQSISGELAFGGRSNQFLHNEVLLSSILEYEAARYQKEGNFALAKTFKAASIRAIEVFEYWLSKTPISHIKNRFPKESKFGCEKYGYFDKYMITAASELYTASLFSDDSIIPSEFDESPMVWSTSKHFNYTFIRGGGYSLEFATMASTQCDANGLGRVHKKGAPSTICLSVPFPFSEEQCRYHLGEYKNEYNFSICPSIKKEEKWIIGASSSVKYTLISSEEGKESARVKFHCEFESGEKVAFDCSVEENGVLLQAQANADEEVAIALPVFAFDGETHTKITESNGKILVEYEGWICEYTAQNISNLEKEFANRNGIYKGYLASGKENVSVRIKIYPSKAE